MITSEPLAGAEPSPAVAWPGMSQTVAPHASDRVMTSARP
jgi:hypothetical protein